MSVSFPIPKGYSAPDGVKEGQEFTEIATFKFDGKQMTISAIGQDKIPLSGKGDEEGKPRKAGQAIKDQLSALEDKSGSAEMQDTEEQE